MLESVLFEKQDCLERMLSIAENQSAVVSSGLSPLAQAMYAGMSDEKKSLSDSALKCDLVFGTIVKELADLMDASLPGCAEIVDRISQRMKMTQALDTLIRVQESRNEDAARRISRNSRPRLAAVLAPDFMDF
jgi:SUMO ligase MMS21 Smc5/6 complex component